MDRINWDTIAEKELWQSICAPNHWFDAEGKVSTHPQSLYYFVQLAWGTEFYFKENPQELRWFYDPIHKPYLAWLQKHILEWKATSLRGITKRKYIASVLPRGFGKTVTTSKSASVWMHLDDPNISILIGSSTTELAKDSFEAIKSVISGENNNSWFSWLYGNWRKGAKQWSEGVKHAYRTVSDISEGSFDYTSVDIGMTGYHHRVHIWSDPIYKNKLREGREAYMRSVHNAVNASYNALQRNGLLLFELTRYLDDDVAGRHFKEEGIASWEGMPCPNTMMFDKVPFGKGEWNVFFWQTEDELTGEPTHPILWSKESIAIAKRLDPEDFACQQQNSPGTGERAPIIESQLVDLYMDYADFLYTVPIKGVSVHLDTAFKTVQTVKKGDDNAIVPWFHDARYNGMVYLDSDNIQCSNEWREEQFNDVLVKVLVNYRRRSIPLITLTDEVEKGGKAGTYKNRLLGILNQAGLQVTTNKFKQINRTSDKKARIRTGLGYWAEGFVRILLHKDKQERWIIPSTTRKMLYQALHIDVVQHEDLMDAGTDVFIPGIWFRPIPRHLMSSEEEGAFVRMPGDESLKSLEGTKAITQEELYEMIDSNKHIQEIGADRLRGWDNPYEDDVTTPRDPV